jgi:hypothetical protein
MPFPWKTYFSMKACKPLAPLAKFLIGWVGSRLRSVTGERSRARSTGESTPPAISCTVDRLETRKGFPKQNGLGIWMVWIPVHPINTFAVFIAVLMSPRRGETKLFADRQKAIYVICHRSDPKGSIIRNCMRWLLDCSHDDFYIRHGFRFGS